MNRTRKTLKSYALLALLISGLSISAASAETTIDQALTAVPGTNKPQAAPDPTQTASLPPEAAQKPFDPSEYAKSSWPAITQALWRMGSLNSNSDEDIDNTLRLLECDIYRKYTSDDFEWADIRAAMRKKIAMQKDRWPNKITFTQDIMLDDYDMDRKSFAITPETRWEDIYRLQIAAQRPENENLCTQGLTDGIDNMPSNASIRMNRPFRFAELVVRDDVAKMYVDYINKKAQMLKTDPERVAYAKFYISLDRYIGPIQEEGGAVQTALGEFAGKIDRIEVYADPELKLPIFTKTDSFMVMPTTTTGNNANKPALIDTSKTLEKR